ncbi:hypothetical protein FNF27_01525 [Cafeteria roenbergensis]|uniref:Cytochrome c oxidase assembly factor 3 mitochondrial coiled-coil domain-containing protein n=1 Tax=Cafeteria roenbergensis TaxID=33653 RepID=A0A5A8DT44_CAFRO|nr:hypothetical protein FNF29_07412 [Cafeteria roenbergensis]KAA0154596.1 hypothetical protein FNF31_06251 [Cafeteria roenbergensis]KAA0167020.1 hypothetical protein FNF28_02943 [Cafeteria roenbergensis]KAA0177196.1 hypothetical protein FNF27_01525 [Cafeteria roenbergensis]|eukprot:KAA0147344.1 hypothetical protein FNF29_07412 [Cafeteria roenbergensis]
MRTSTKNFLVATTLLAFVSGVYTYTIRQMSTDDLEEIQREIDILKATERAADAAAAKYSPPAQAADLQPFKKPVQDGERS